MVVHSSRLKQAFNKVFAPLLQQPQPQHFFADPPRRFGFGTRGDSVLSIWCIDLPVHSHLDFKALIAAVNSCELLLLQATN